MTLTLPSTLTPSKLGKFVSCPLAFRYSYIEHLPEPPTVYQLRGTLLHRALQLLFEAPAAERSRERATSALEEASTELAEEIAALGLEEGERAAFARESGTLLERYFNLEDPSKVQPVGLELDLRASSGRRRAARHHRPPRPPRRRPLCRRRLQDGALTAAGTVPLAPRRRAVLRLPLRAHPRHPAERGPADVPEGPGGCGGVSDRSVDAWSRPTGAGGVGGDRAGVRLRRLPPEPLAALPKLRLPGLLPRVRGGGLLSAR